MQQFQGIIGTPVTPFTPQGDLDEATIGQLFQFMVDSGVDGVATPMHIGESINMSIDERKHLVRLAVDTVAGRVPVLVNVSYAGTRVAVDLARHAESVGANGLVCLPPYHWAPPPAGVLAHFQAIGNATGLPIVLYNSPKVGVTITGDLLRETIATVPTVVGMKDASFNMRYLAESARVGDRAKPGFTVFSGIDYPLPAMAVGARGTFSLFAQLVPRLAVRLLREAESGDWAAARVDQQRIDELWVTVRSGYASGIKAALTIMGRPCGPSRLPVVPYTTEQLSRLETAMSALEFLADEPRGWSLPTTVPAQAGAR